MRVLIITSTFPPTSGGAETYAANLADGLVERGHEVDIVTDGSYPVPEGFDADFRFGVHRIPDIRSVDSQKVAWRDVLFAITNAIDGLSRPDVVHANSHECLYPASIAALHWGVPLVASLHEQNPQDEPFGLGRVALAARHFPVSRFLAGSEHYSQAMKRIGVDEHRRRLVLHGVPTVPNVGLEESGVETAPDHPVVLCPGRIDPRKNQLMLVHAMSTVLKTYPNAKLIFAGRVTDRAYAERIYSVVERHAMGGSLEICSVADPTEMRSLYARATVVVQPSTEEGLGLAVIEAMHCGTATIVTDVTGLRETVVHDESGIVVPLGDSQALAEELLSMIGDEERRVRLGRGALRRAQETFSLERMVRETETVYQEAIEERAE